MHWTLHLLLVIGVVDLLVGILGFMYTSDLSFEDAFLNASMTVGGMGLPNVPKTTLGKKFASCYALFNGVFFVAIFAGVLVNVLKLSNADL